MLFHPIKRVIRGINAYRGFRKIQKIKNKSCRPKIKAKPKPRSEINHHLVGFKYGAKADNKKTIAARIFKKRKNLFAKTENLAAINAI